jgi:NADH-quinone oxidoreductase subunit N
MFSMIGIPPLAGFLGKYYVLFDLVSLEEYRLVIIALMASLISAYYYLRIITSIYFEEAKSPAVKIELSTEFVVVIAACLLFTVFFIFGAAEYFSSLKIIPL